MANGIDIPSNSVTVISTWGPKQPPLGKVTDAPVPLIFAFPAVLRAKEPVLPATVPPQTSVTAISVTSAVPATGISNPAILPFTAPVGDMVTDPLVNSQFAPAVWLVATPPITGEAGVAPIRSTVKLWPITFGQTHRRPATISQPNTFIFIRLFSLKS